MTYIPEDAFKNILDFCDDRIEQKQRQLMRSIKIERDTEIIFAKGPGGGVKGEHTHEGTSHIHADLVTYCMDKFTYTAGDQKLLCIRSDEGMSDYNEYREGIMARLKLRDGPARLRYDLPGQGGWWEWVREPYVNINYNYERSWSPRNLVKSKTVYKEGQRVHRMYWI